eukprot:441397-Alexandrium_andersonii.AAC.1
MALWHEELRVLRRGAEGAGEGVERAPWAHHVESALVLAAPGVSSEDTCCGPVVPARPNSGQQKRTTYTVVETERLVE